MEPLPVEHLLESQDDDVTTFKGQRLQPPIRMTHRLKTDWHRFPPQTLGRRAELPDGRTLHGSLVARRRRLSLCPMLLYCTRRFPLLIEIGFKTYNKHILT